MKTKTQQEKSSRENHQKSTNRKKSEKTQKIPSRMGYHGKDEEKNLNPEE